MHKSKKKLEGAVVYNSKNSHAPALFIIVAVVVAAILGGAYVLRSRTASPEKKDKPMVVAPSEPKAFVAEFLSAYNDGNKRRVNELISQTTNDDKAFNGKDNYYDYCASTTACNEALKSAIFDMNGQNVTVADATDNNGIKTKKVTFRFKAADQSDTGMSFQLVDENGALRFYRFDYETGL